MIPRAAIPVISRILPRLDVSPDPRSRTDRGRTQCPVHRGDNRQAFSYDDRAGLWYCHRCGIGGDAIDLVRRALDISFRDALRFLGVEPGRYQSPDPEDRRRKKIRANLRKWAHMAARDLRDRHFVRFVVQGAAADRLRQNPDDTGAWDALARALTGLAALEYRLDVLTGTDADMAEAYKNMRRDACHRPEEAA